MSRTELKNHQRELHDFRIRLLLGGLFVLTLFGVLAARLLWLQIFAYEHYQTLAENNRISIIPVVPNRGLILDRNGEILAHNYSAYTLEITPSKAGNLEQTINSLAEIVDITPRDRKRFRKLLEESRNFETLPIRSRLNDVEVAKFAANRFRFPGVEIKARLFRHYPKGELASHAIGHIGRINETDLKDLEESGELANYKGGSHVGKLGLEQKYEKHLHGETGFQQIETDAGGRAVRVLSQRAPVSGNNLYLTLDSRLQEVAEKAFGQFRGAMVAIEPQSGEVLAFVSKPGFDPNLFIDGIDPVNWDALNNSPDRPLNNRALRGQYPPGSTIKPFMALAGLELGKRTPSYTIADPGFFTLPGSSHRYRDWKVGGHGSVDLHKSIVISCDTYYYGLANDLGPDAIFNFMSRFGFGKKTGIDIEGEAFGLMPSREWKMKRHKQKWYAGDTISVGIGQGYWLSTPLQLAYATAILANKGVAAQPHLVRSILDNKSGKISSLPFRINAGQPFKEDHLERIRLAMIDVTLPGGTATRVGVGAPYPVAGKTGTAQVIGIKQNEKYVESRVAEHHRDHALFMAYAPADNPKIALAIVVENGGHGGSTAGPIARQILDFFLLGKLPEDAAASAEAATPEDEEHD